MAGSKPKVRVGLEVLATIVAEDGLPRLGKTSNVSSTGMLLELSSPLEVGAKIKVRLFIPGRASRIELDGEITREGKATAERRQYGVKFAELSPDTEFELARFLAIRLDRIGPSR